MISTWSVSRGNVFMLNPKICQNSHTNAPVQRSCVFSVNFETTAARHSLCNGPRSKGLMQEKEKNLHSDTLLRTSLWQPRYRWGRMRVGPMLVTGRQGWEIQEGTRVDFPSHRPGNRWENSEKPPERNRHTNVNDPLLQDEVRVSLQSAPLHLLPDNTPLNWSSAGPAWAWWRDILLLFYSLYCDSSPGCDPPYLIKRQRGRCLLPKHFISRIFIWICRRQIIIIYYTCLLFKFIYIYFLVLDVLLSWLKHIFFMIKCSIFVLFWWS